MDDNYAERTDLLLGAFRRGDGRGVALGDLIAVMKDKSSAKDYLSSLYFAGAEGDHPFFLRNDRMAMGLAVLPEEASKAGLRKRHPHQTEVIVVLDGTLRLEIAKNNGQHLHLDLAQGDVHVIEPGECHRITPVEGQDAAYLFVKTNPAQEPRGEACDL